METATDYYAVHRHHCTIRRFVCRIVNEIAYPDSHGEPPPITLEQPPRHETTMQRSILFLTKVRRITAPVLAIGILVVPAISAAQQHGTSGNRAPATSAPKEAAQFDFLVGQWELTVMPKVTGLAARIHGAPRLVGTWKAWRAFDGFGIQDELRIMDGSGNPNSLSHSMRVYSATDKRWIVSGVDVYRGRTFATHAIMRGAEMTVTGNGVDAEGKAYLTRSRFHGISRDRFLFQQDRSTDNGRSWTEAVLKIEAKRIAATAPR